MSMCSFSLSLSLSLSLYIYIYIYAHTYTHTYMYYRRITKGSRCYSEKKSLENLEKIGRSS